MSARLGSRYDSIVVGGGHNGLVCAAYLARSGRSVLVLEAAPQVGGAAVTREFAPGFRVSACAHLLHLMPPALMRELDLEPLGLKLAAADLPTTALATDGAHLPLGSAATAALARALAGRCGRVRRLAGPSRSASPRRCIRCSTRRRRGSAPRHGAIARRSSVSGGGCGGSDGAICASCCASAACACTTCSRTASSCRCSRARWRSMRCSAPTTARARRAPY